MRAIFSNPTGWKFIDSNGWKKIKFWRKKFFRKNCCGASTFSATNMQFLHNQRFWTFFYVFHHVNLFFFKNNKNLEHLNVLLRIFFVSGVFQNFDVDFWPLLKAEKVLAPKQFWRGKKSYSKFYFLSSIWIYKLSVSRILCI